MIKEQNKTVLFWIIVVMVLAVIVFGVRACSYKKIDDKSAQSIANDYNGEMKVLVDRGMHSKSTNAMKELLDDINDFKSRCRNLKSEEKEYLDKELYVKVINLQSKLEDKLEKIFNSKDDVDKLDAELDGIDENIDVKENIDMIEKLVNKYYKLPDQSRYTLLNYRKMQDIEKRYNSLVSSEVEAMIDELGEVEYSREYKKKLDDIHNAYVKLNLNAQYNVSNYLEYHEKVTEFTKLELKNGRIRD